MTIVSLFQMFVPDNFYYESYIKPSYHGFNSLSLNISLDRYLNIKSYRYIIQL